MRTPIFGLMLVVGVLVQAAIAGGDVGYGLEVERLEAPKVAKNVESPEMRFEDRSWATLGIQESTAIFSYRGNTGIAREPKKPEAHHVVNELFWPATRAMIFGNPEVDHQAWSFSIALQR